MKAFVMMVLAGMALLWDGAPAAAFQEVERGAIIREASEVDLLATRLAEWARDRRYGAGYGEAQAEQSLRRFAERSRHFLSEAERWRGGRRQLRDDFYRLQESWNRVQDSFERLRPDRVVYGDFLRLREAMFRLAELSRKTPVHIPEPRRHPNWWDQIWHSHHTGCGHYFWGGRWQDEPERREYHIQREIRTGPARIRVE